MIIIREPKSWYYIRTELDQVRELQQIHFRIRVCVDPLVRIRDSSPHDHPHALASDRVIFTPSLSPVASRGYKFLVYRSVRARMRRDTTRVVLDFT